MRCRGAECSARDSSVLACTSLLAYPLLSVRPGRITRGMKRIESLRKIWERAAQKRHEQELVEVEAYMAFLDEHRRLRADQPNTLARAAHRHRAALAKLRTLSDRAFAAKQRLDSAIHSAG